MLQRRVGSPSVLALLAALAASTSAWAGAPVNLTFTVEEISENVCPEDFPEACPGDYFVLVNIGSNIPGNGFVRHDYPDNVGTIRSPLFFSTSRLVDTNFGLIEIEVQLRERDGILLDDHLDITSSDNDRNLNLVYEPRTRQWAGDVGLNVDTSSGSGARIRFSITDDDRDEDWLQDNWETGGTDFDNNGMIDSDENLAAMGASPDRKDVFVEVDCIVAGDHTHCPRSEVIRDVVQSFANAPVLNLDGTRGVQLHVDTGPLYGAGSRTTVTRTGGGAAGSFGDLGGGGTAIPEAGNEIIDFDGPAGNPGTSFYTLKGAPNLFFDATRALAFRYSIFGHRTNRPSRPCAGGNTDATVANDFFVTLGGINASEQPCWTPDANGFSVGSRVEQADAFMHELGHALGLRHGGGDEINNKPNYLSVMNYSFENCSVPVSASAGLPGGCDYSRIALPSLNETRLDECLGIGGNVGFGRVDWDADGKVEGVTNCEPPFAANQIADTNNDGVCIEPGPNNARNSTATGDDGTDRSRVTDGPNRICDTMATPDDVQSTAVGATPPQPDELNGFNDWDALRFDFRAVPGFANDVASPLPDEADPQTLADARASVAAVMGPTVEIEIGGPATILPGQTVTWMLDVRNVGRGPAFDTVFVDKNPDGSIASAFERDPFVLHDSFADTVQYAVAADACPQDLVNRGDATYRDIAGTAYTSSDTGVTRVLDIVPPTLAVAVSPGTLWPPDHKLRTIDATVTATDDCDPNPVVELVSVRSSEPDNGLGDGDTAGDVQGALFGTRDLRFRVRSERSGTGSGRLYTVTYEARDASGNATVQQTAISVPQSQ